PVREAPGRLLRVPALADRGRRGLRAHAGRGERAHGARFRLRHARTYPDLPDRRARDRRARAARLRAGVPPGAGRGVGDPRRSLVTLTHVIYGLHAASLLTGILGVATVVGAFLLGWPSIIAVILNYVKRGEASGTWLESHFRWQIRTFWYGLLWVGLCTLFVVLTLGIGIFIAWVPLGLVGLWFIYRIARGWLRLVDRQPMY